MDVGVTEDRTQLNGFLYGQGLANPHETARWTPLAGGVSSEIWRVDLPGRSLCVKRALPKLKVAADWRAPVSRNAYEWKWLCFAAKHVPSAVPKPLAHDASAGLFAMSFLAPEHYPTWKSQLMNGIVAPEFAAQVGSVLARLHTASAGQPELAREFDSLNNFRALRIEPYLLATAARHSDLDRPIRELAERTTTIALALVHGDVSPKNILAGHEGPVFLDAECAWYGDPAFDVAFCLNHLLLKCLVRPDRTSELAQSFSQFADSYFDSAGFESRPLLESRVAELLPALMLARVDGKSPVEYLVGKDAARMVVRRVANLFLRSPAKHPGLIMESWLAEIDTLRRPSFG